MFPKTRYQFALPVAMFVQAFFEEIIREQSCLWQAVHPSLGLDVDAAIFGGFLSEIIFFDYFIGYVS